MRKSSVRGFYMKKLIVLLLFSIFLHHKLLGVLM
jgi:hypothetical protein